MVNDYVEFRIHYVKASLTTQIHIKVTSMTVIVSCVNLKGGVGKTALAVNLAAIAGDIYQKKTLLIDVDPQTNATFSCITVDDWEEWAASNGTIADILDLRNHTSAEGSVREPQEVIIPDVFDNVDLLPSHLDLFTVDLDLSGRTSRERILRRNLQKVIDEYELIICDCPPNLTLPTQNALSVSSYYMVPVSLDYLSGLGVGLLISRIERFGQEMETVLTNAGIIISRVGRPARHREETEGTIRQQFGDLVLPQMLKERSSVSEAGSLQIPVHKHSDREAKREFLEVAEELLNRLQISE